MRYPAKLTFHEKRLVEDYRKLERSGREKVHEYLWLLNLKREFDELYEVRRQEKLARYREKLDLEFYPDVDKLSDYEVGALMTAEKYSDVKKPRKRILAPLLQGGC
jgi:hypothetical protein